MGREERERILAVKLSSLGDVIHATPCLRAIRRARPEAEIVLAVEARFADAVRHDPHVDALLEVPPRARLLPARAEMLWRALRPLPGRRYDVALDLQGNWKSAAFVYASRARFRAGRADGRRPGWDLVLDPDLSRHAVLVCAEVCAAAGFPLEGPPRPEVLCGAEDDRALAAILAARGLPLEGAVVVNPLTLWPSKTWPLERFAELIAGLRREAPEVPVLVSGGPGEARECERLVSLAPKGAARSLAGALSLGQALCLWRRARLLITNDSGPMHAAAALGTPTVALFGPTLPERTGPFGEGHAVIQRSRPRSHYDYRLDPDARRHMLAIGVAEVLAATLGALERRWPAPALAAGGGA